MDRVARTITQLTHPALVVTLLLLSLPLRASGTPWRPVIIATTFSAALPCAALLLMRVRRQVSNMNVTVRRQRLPLLLFSLVSMLIGATLLVVTSAPPVVLLEVGLVLAGLLITGAITVGWKISMHTAVAAFAFLHAGAGTVLGAHLTVVVIVLIAWSRIQMNQHTPSQVLAGACVGALVSWLGWLATVLI